jgi:hypothetical protein
MALILVGHPPEAVSGLDPIAPCLAHAAGAGRIGDQIAQRMGEDGLITEVDQDAGLFILDQFG